MKTRNQLATVDTAALVSVIGGAGRVDDAIMRSLDDVGDNLKNLGKTDSKGGMGDMTTMLLLMTLMGPKGGPPPPPPQPVPVAAPASSVNVVVARR